MESVREFTSTYYEMGITYLRDAMTTMKYCQIEKYGKAKRKDISREDFNKMIQASLEEYPKFKREYEEECIYIKKN